MSDDTISWGGTDIFVQDKYRDGVIDQCTQVVHKYMKLLAKHPVIADPTIQDDNWSQVVHTIAQVRWSVSSLPADNWSEYQSTLIKRMEWELQETEHHVMSGAISVWELIDSVSKKISIESSTSSYKYKGITEDDDSAKVDLKPIFD